MSVVRREPDHLFPWGKSRQRQADVLIAVFGRGVAMCWGEEVVWALRLSRLHIPFQANCLFYRSVSHKPHGTIRCPPSLRFTNIHLTCVKEINNSARKGTFQSFPNTTKSSDVSVILLCCMPYTVCRGWAPVYL